MLTGQCRCGAVRYTVALDGLPRSYACHCHQCQQWSGSAFSQQVLVAEDRLEVHGELAVYALTTEDRTSLQRFCAACHTRIYNTNTRRPGVAVIRAGTLDRAAELVPAAHIYTASRQPWIVLPPGVPQWPDMAPADEFLAAVAN